MSVLDLADRLAEVDDLLIRSLPDGEIVTYAELWSRAQCAATELEARAGAGAVALILTNSLDMSAVLLGAIIAGVPVVSLPIPPARSAGGWYETFLNGVCVRYGVTTVVAEPDVQRRLPDVSLSVLTPRDVWAGGRPTRTPTPGFSITQFTSGSTSAPKGVPLTAADIVANVDAILERLAPGRREVVCSWLPLSHDMGLIGTFFTPLLGAQRGRGSGGELVFLATEHFMWRPQSWLAACSEFGATITAASDFGLQIATRMAGRSRLDLSPLRTIVVGAEPVRSATLQAFTSAFAAEGLRPCCPTPAYGMAEAALAVTMTEVDEMWRTVRLDGAAGGDASAADGYELVSAGRPLEGYDVSIRHDNGVFGEIHVSGPSVPPAYADGRPIRDADGWYATGDLGFVDGGELFVLGRQDDMFSRKGRNVYVRDVEAAAEGTGAVRRGRVVSGAGFDGWFFLIAESASAAAASSDALVELRAAVTERTGVTPDYAALLRPGDLPLTGSGKPRRNDALSSLREGRIAPLVAIGELTTST